MPAQVSRGAGLSSKSRMRHQSRTLKLNQTGGMVWSYLPLKLVNALEPIAEYYPLTA